MNIEYRLGSNRKTTEVTSAADIAELFEGNGHIPRFTLGSLHTVMDILHNEGLSSMGGSESFLRPPLLEDATGLLTQSQRRSAVMFGPLVVGDEYRPAGFALYQHDQPES